MKVQVAAPEIDGETVRFRWTQSEPNPFQRQDEFFFRFEGIALASFAPELFYEIFLALQLQVFAAYREPVEVAFPTPVPRPTAEFWLAYHHADRVTVAPLAAVGSYSPWATGPAPHDLPRTAAVFFGGGKDSTLTTCLLAELYGADQVVLVQFVGPLNPSVELERRLTLRQEGLMLRPARERLGVATQRVWTDYQAQFRPEGYHRRPHLELYTAGALPALLTHGVSLASFSHVWSDYPFTRAPDGQLDFRFAPSRPETLAAQSRHYRRALGADLTITNLALPFSGLTTVRLLAERYPTALARIVPCTLGAIEERWCYQCVKCVSYAFFGLAWGFVDPTFDYDRAFAESRYMQRLVAYAASGVERSDEGNAPWTPALSSPFGYPTFGQTIAQISPDLIADRLSPAAKANLLIVKYLFGNRTFPAVQVLATRTIEVLNHEAARGVGRIAAEHLPIVEDLPGPFLAGNDPIDYDFRVVIPTRFACLAHLRDDPASAATGHIGTEAAG